MEHDAEPGYPDPWKNVLRQLLSLRLFQPTSVMDDDGQPLVCRVHRLLQELVLRDCPTEERARRQQAVDGLVKERDTLLGKTTRWKDARWELEPLTAHAAWLLNQTGLRWHHLAEWSQAEPLMRRALSLMKRVSVASIERSQFASTTLRNCSKRPTDWRRPSR